MSTPALQYPGTSVWRIRRTSRHPLEFLDALARQGDFVPFMLGGRPAVLLNRPDYVSTVLLSQASRFQKGRANQRARNLLGSGLLTADEGLHARRLRLIQPAFARRRRAEFVAAIVSRASAMCDTWSPGSVVDVASDIGQLAFSVVGCTVIGADVSSEFHQVKTAVADATASLDPLLSLVAPVPQVRRARARLRRIAHAIAARASEEAPDGSLLALLKADVPREASEEQDCDDLLTILLAGYDTISSALTWSWALLAANPAAESAMREEVASVLGSRPAGPADIPGLRYTRAVIAEALRLYPPAWVLAREAVAPHQFDDGEVAPGTIVLMSQYLLHRDGRFFDRPAVFDPARWLPGNHRPHSRFAYFPFGAGARSCIGETFAWMESVLLLATVAQRCRLKTVDGCFPGIDARITLRPRGPALMVVC